jgi:hypothetical protein
MKLTALCLEDFEFLYLAKQQVRSTAKRLVFVFGTHPALSRLSLGF